MRLDTLTPERWKRVRELLDLYLDESDPTRRDALLEPADVDTELRAAVLSAASEFSDSEDLLGCAPPPRIDTLPSAALQPGELAGAYRVDHEIARGGMGAVYLASRADNTFAKKVAIKALPRGGSATALELFQRERQILAMLDHPNITHILDAGTTARGTNYVVMEYVEGEPITTWAAKPGRPFEDVLRVFLQVCSAIQHAHANLVLHCDLKPSNILVTRDGVPRVLDFGLGHFGQQAAKAAGLTRAYASPEQLRGELLSTLSDLYSLGVILRELAGPEPIANDLRAIIAKATQAEPSMRYESVQDFAADIRRFLEIQPVEARNGGWGYHARRYFRRHRWRAAGIALLTAAIGLGVTGTISQRRLAERRYEDIRGLARSVIFQYQQELARIQGSTALRARMAADTVQYLDKIETDAAGDPDLRLEIAQAYRKVAEAEGYLHVPNIGDIRAAQASLVKSVAILRELVARDPGNGTLARELAVSLEHQANLLLLAGRNQDARATALQSVAELDRLAPIKGSSYPAERSAAWRELAAALVNLGLTTEAIEAARLSAASATDAPQAKEARVLAFLQLSRAIQMGIGPNAESRDYALAAAREFTVCAKGDSVCAVSRITAVMGLARHYGYARQTPQAISTAAGAEREAAEALAEDPSDWRLWRLLRLTQTIQGEAYRNARQMRKALEKFRQAVDTSVRMRQNDPLHPEASCTVIATKARYGEVLIEEFRDVAASERELTEAVRLADSQNSDSLACLDSRKMAVINLARVAEAKGDWAGGMEWRRETVRNALRYAAKSPGEPLALVIEAGANYELGLGSIEAAKHGDAASRLAEGRRALLRSREIYKTLASMGNPIQTQYDGWPARVEKLISEIDRKLAAL